VSAAVTGDAVGAIARDLFAVMVDGVPGTLHAWDAPAPVWVEPVAAWVDLHGDWSGRAVVTTERRTADGVARALLDLPDDAPVGDDDLRDAFGEVANVVGGNVKSLLPTTGSMGLPQVGATEPAPAGSVVVAHVLLDWGGRALELTVRAAP